MLTNPMLKAQSGTVGLTSHIARNVVNRQRLFTIASHLVLFAVTYFLSFLLRFDFAVRGNERRLFAETLPIVMAQRFVAFWYFGLFSCSSWKCVGLADVRDIVAAAWVSSFTIWFTIMILLRPLGYPRSVLLIDLSLMILITGGVRIAFRFYAEEMKKYTPDKNTLIAGAGVAGTELARQLKRNPDLEYNPIGFVDDDRKKLGVRMQGIKVLGTTADISDIVNRQRVECVIIAIPSARGRVVQRIVENCRAAKVEFKILQGIGRRINGQSFTKVRNVQLEDILGREPVRLELSRIRHELRDKVVFITGAGGSIGSELCRQVAEFRPSKLILFERSENDLFKISNELSVRFPKLMHVPVIGDILDVAALREAFAVYRPNSVFHAAAYKHVPMMELNCFQAVANNVFGTYNVALVARQYEAEEFVMISSDKAVKPTNVMGATKRIGELIILGLQHQTTRYVAVRFGNVIGSNGSVVPLFEEQIAKGGPVLVTHSEATRYFMTIPEAVQLVLQASTMGRGGEIFILKMGEPVRIAALACNMIRLCGYEPDRDIEIVYTGLRPGEKVHEELSLEQEGIAETSHEKVCVLHSKGIDFGLISGWLDDLSRHIEAKDVDGLIATLKTIVPEYSPSKELLSKCGVHRHDFASKYRSRTRSIANRAA